MKILRYPLHHKLHAILDFTGVNSLKHLFYTKGVRLVDLSVKDQFHAQVMDPLNNQLYFELYIQLKTYLYENN